MKRTKHETKLFETELGAEILVSYNQVWNVSERVEDFFGEHRFPEHELVHTELLSVELIIKGRGINVLPLLDKIQIKFIIEQL